MRHCTPRRAQCQLKATLRGVRLREGHGGNVGAWGGKGKPRRSGAQHERAGRAGNGQRGRLYRWLGSIEQPAATAILHGLARRTAPQAQPPRSGSRARRWAAQGKPRQKEEPPAGPKWGMSLIGGLAHCWATYKFRPLRSVTQADSVVVELEARRLYHWPVTKYAQQVGVGVVVHHGASRELSGAFRSSAAR